MWWKTLMNYEKMGFRVAFIHTGGLPYIAIPFKDRRAIPPTASKAPAHDFNVGTSFCTTQDTGNE